MFGSTFFFLTPEIATGSVAEIVFFVEDFWTVVIHTCFPSVVSSGHEGKLQDFLLVLTK